MECAGLTGGRNRTGLPDTPSDTLKAGLTIFRTKTENQSEVVPMIVYGPCLDPVWVTVVFC